MVELGARAEGAVQARFAEAFASFDGNRPCLLIGHNDADGLSSIVLLARVMERAGRAFRLRVVGRGESAWSAQMRAEVANLEPGGVIACDLGVGAGDVAPAVPTVIIDHHVPRGGAGAAVVISGLDFDPVPTTSLLAFWSAHAVGDADDLLWLAAIGLIGDMAEGAGFSELAEARRRYGVTRLRRAVSLINAARRRGQGDAGPALNLLMKAAGPEEVVSGVHPETAELEAAKREVADAMERARRAPPKIRNGVALIRADSPCQIHPLLAQQWRGRLKNEVVLAANAAFRPGWVHFAARSARDLDLIAFLAERAPPGADENYGSGHRAATGGALRYADWNTFIRGLGFGAEDEVR